MPPHEFTEESIVSRAQWGAKDPLRELETMTLPATDVILSYSGTNPCNSTEECKQMMRDLQAEYQKNNIPDIAPNFLVGGDGSVFEGRGWNKKPLVHPNAPDLHGKSIEICHFGEKGVRPPQEMIAKAWSLADYGVRRGFIANGHGHYSFFQVWPTDPGKPPKKITYMH